MLASSCHYMLTPSTSVVVGLTRLYGYWGAGSARTALAVGRHREAVVLATGEVRKVCCGDVSGDVGCSVSCLGRDHIQISPIPAIPAERKHPHITVDRSSQIVG